MNAVMEEYAGMNWDDAIPQIWDFWQQIFLGIFVKTTKLRTLNAPKHFQVFTRYFTGMKTQAPCV